MGTVKNIDKYVIEGVCSLREGGIFLWKYGITEVGHEDNVFSCSKPFLPYIADKTKKNGILFVFYLCFCLSLRHI